MTKAANIPTWRERVKGLDKPTDFAEAQAAKMEAGELRRALVALESRVLAERKTIYQVQKINGDWIDIDKTLYDRYVDEHASNEVCRHLRIVFPHPTPDDASIHARIPKGWRFYTCDFSMQDSPGSVTLKRDKEGVSWWFGLPDEQREKTDLFVYGRGKTIEEALDAAIDRARQSVEEGKS